jgi:hypothetical protein
MGSEQAGLNTPDGKFLHREISRQKYLQEETLKMAHDLSESFPTFRKE